MKLLEYEPIELLQIENRILRILLEAYAGKIRLSEVFAKYQISERQFYEWKIKYIDWSED